MAGTGGLGMLGFIGLARESSGGIPVAAQVYIEALSESLTLEYERIETVNLAGRISEPDDYLGAAGIGGEISMAAEPKTLGYFLSTAMADSTATVVVTDSLFQHVFRPATISHWDSRFAQRPLTLEIFRDVGSSQQYTGININELTLNAAYNQDLRLTAAVLGLGATNIAKTSPTFVGEALDPFGFDTASISINGAANVDVEAITWTLGNNLEAVGTLANKRFRHKIRRAGMFQPRFEMTVSFDDVTDLQRFVNQTELGIKAHFSRATSYGLTLDMPRAVFTAYPTGVTGRGRQTVTIPGMARHHVGSGTSIEATLLTSVNTH